MNLVVNARDAMPHGGRLTLDTSIVEIHGQAPSSPRELPPGTYVVLTVSDTGVGMDHETRSHLFEPFFTTKPPGKGTGLGLSTVFGIVNQSGGRITVDSRAGEGTTFRIFLPAARVTAPAPAKSTRSASHMGGHEVILLAEDEPAVRRLVTRSLERL
jgi:signal transduction histidine kinase